MLITAIDLVKHGEKKGLFQNKRNQKTAYQMFRFKSKKDNVPD